MAALEPGHGWVDFEVGAKGDPMGIAAFARGEAGVKLLPNLGAFAFGEADLEPQQGLSWQAGLAVKGTFLRV